MTVKMAKTARSATIASDITGKTPPIAEELGVVCPMDMGNTAHEGLLFPFNLFITK
jgi:hypothetical protein